MGDVGEKTADEIQPTGEGAACRESGERTAPDRRVVRTRKAIRQAFLTLMQETEYQKITITGIAREADRIVRTCLDSLENSDDGENVVDLFKRLSLGLAPDLKSMKLIASHTPYELVLKKLESSLTASLIEQDTLGLKKLGPYLDFCVAYFSAGLVAVIRRWILDESEIPLEDIAQVTHALVHSGLDGIVRTVAEGGVKE